MEHERSLGAWKPTDYGVVSASYLSARSKFYQGQCGPEPRAEGYIRWAIFRIEEMRLEESLPMIGQQGALVYSIRAVEYAKIRAYILPRGS